MPHFKEMTDRQVLVELVKHRAIAEKAAQELMKRAVEDAA